MDHWATQFDCSTVHAIWKEGFQTMSPLNEYFPDKSHELLSWKETHTQLFDWMWVDDIIVPQISTLILRRACHFSFSFYLFSKSPVTATQPSSTHWKVTPTCTVMTASLCQVMWTYQQMSCFQLRFSQILILCCRFSSCNEAVWQNT